MRVINIAVDFSATPGARFKSDGEFSGQEFREKLLEPLFEDAVDNSEIKIILDGVEGYSTSFLEEAFGGLARNHTAERCLKRLRFISNDEPLLINEIESYIKNTKKQ